MCKEMFEMFLLGPQNLCLIAKKTDNYHFWGYIFLCLPLIIQQLIIQNQNTSPKDFNFLRIDCNNGVTLVLEVRQPFVFQKMNASIKLSLIQENTMYIKV